MKAHAFRLTGGAGRVGRSANEAVRNTGSASGPDRRVILVTGGAGYIGSHTCKALAEAGFRPVVLDNLSTGHRWAVRWGPFAEGDLSDRAFIAEVLKTYRASAVMHFAGSAYVNESMSHPGKYFRNNVTNTLNLLDAMTETGVRHLVFSSSCATYGIPPRIPIRETTAQNPINPYGESKKFVEKMLHWYDTAHALRSYALRYFNAAGDDPDGEIGEDHDPETHLIPLVIRTALGMNPHVDILGTDYDTPDGTAIRDYIHVRDLARAHVSAVQQLLDGRPSRRLNLGTGRGHSVLSIIKAVERISGLPVRARKKPRRPGDPAVLVASHDEASRILDWKPLYSDLDTIIRSALAWHQKQAGTATGEVEPENKACRKPVLS